MACKHEVCHGEPSRYNTLRITLRGSAMYTVELIGYCTD